MCSAVCRCVIISHHQLLLWHHLIRPDCSSAFGADRGLVPGADEVSLFGADVGTSELLSR